jgi:hypothetical protein
MASTEPKTVPMAVCSTAENTYSFCTNIGGSSFKSINVTFTSTSPVRVSSVISIALIWKKEKMLFYKTINFVVLVATTKSIFIIEIICSYTKKTH